jgi:predicted Zn-dependent peptidase
MTPPRVLPPVVAAPTPVRFPPIARDELASGLRVWSVPWPPVPLATVALLIEAGSVDEPADRAGLASLSADLLDEGAGGRTAVELSEAFARLGTRLETDVGPDTTLLSFTTLARHLDAAVALLADVVMRPHLAEQDLRRIRDLRVSRLRQLTTSASAMADRGFLAGVFGAHPYGHGTLGTRRALEAVSLDEARRYLEAACVARRATLIVAGDVSAGDATAVARARFRDWRAGPESGLRSVPAAGPMVPRYLLVDRPGAPQSELRIGHLGPPRRTPAFHALATLNAALGGQFTSRINQELRETKGYTYGARTGFDFRLACSTFACDTSVQSDATVEAIADVMTEFAAVGAARPVDGDELARAQSSLTRGYVRHFETAAQLVRGAVELARFGLPDDTFDRFVPGVAAATAEDVLAAARDFVRPDACTVVVVGDAERHRTGLRQFRPDFVEVTPEF